MNRILLSLLALLAGALPLSAAPQGKASGELYTRVQGEFLQFAIDIEIDDGFHLYHHELGAPDSVGKPLSVTLSGEGLGFDELVWPEPHRFEQPELGDDGGDTFILGHEDRLVIYGRAELGEGASEDDLSVKLDGLTCEDNGSCYPYGETLETSGEGKSSIWKQYPASLGAPAIAADLENPAEEGFGFSAFGSNQPEANDSNKAHGKLYARVEDGRLEFAIDIAIDDGFHLYHKELGGENATGLPLTVELSGDGLEFDELEWPEPHRYVQPDYIDGGETYILGFDERLLMFGRAELAAGADADALSATLNGQTCEDDGSCYLYKETLAVSGPGAADLWAKRGASATTTSHAADVDPAGDAPDSDEGAGGKKKKGSLWALILAAIGGGIFALLMPCTYPMIPITISFFTKQAESRGGNVMTLALLYGAGIVLIFVAIALSVGSLIMPFATHPITNLILGLVFVIFAAALFGIITLNPPKSMMSMAGKASTTGGLLGVFLMGMTLVLTSFTCTAPFVGTLLSASAAEGRSLWEITLGMGVFGLTMAVPFTALSLVPGKLQAMPSSGEWMNTLKVSLGFVELAAALKFFSNVDLRYGWGFLSRELFLLLWVLIFIFAGLYLLGWIKVKGYAVSEISAGRMMGALFFLSLAAYCWHGYRGHTMDGIMTAIIPNYSSAPGAGVHGGGNGEGGDSTRPEQHEIITDDFESAKASALRQGRPVLLNFTGFL